MNFRKSADVNEHRSMFRVILTNIRNRAGQYEISDCFSHAFRQIIQFVCEFFFVLKDIERFLFFILDWNNRIPIYSSSSRVRNSIIPFVGISVAEYFVCTNIQFGSRKNCEKVLWEQVSCGFISIRINKDICKRCSSNAEV